MQAKERIAVRVFRAAFRAWPFMHGRGWILRAARLVFGRDPVRFQAGRGAFIEDSLDDWMTLWTFMCLHERDAPFQRSLELLKPGDVAVDVGANFGIWSLLAATRIESGRVHAFEPVPAMVEHLRAHVELNGARAVSIHAIALGAESGSLPFFAVTEGNRGASALVRRHAGDVEIRVDVVTLDDWLEREALPRVDLVKVDVEGAELFVFRGARRLLASDRAPKLFFEIDDQLCAAFGITSRDVKQLLADCGYGIYRWQGRAFEPVPVDERHGHEDLFAFKPRHLAELQAG